MNPERTMLEETNGSILDIFAKCQVKNGVVDFQHQQGQMHRPLFSPCSNIFRPIGAGALAAIRCSITLRTSETRVDPIVKLTLRPLYEDLSHISIRFISYKMK